MKDWVGNWLAILLEEFSVYLHSFGYRDKVYGRFGHLSCVDEYVEERGYFFVLLHFERCQLL